MAASGERSAAARGRRSRDEAAHNRLGRRLNRIPPQVEALRRALEPFGGESFDPARWEAAFESSDPDAINLVGAAINDYNSVVNNLVEAVRSGVKTVGLEPTDGSWQEQSFRAYIETVLAGGGISAGQRDTLITLNQMRNRLQHDSPSVGADEAQAEIEELLRSIRGLLKSYLAWLERHGLKL